jgi:hypothetical protein
MFILSKTATVPTIAQAFYMPATVQQRTPDALESEGLLYRAGKALFFP